MMTDVIAHQPITEARIADCHRSAKFWVNQLPVYADKMQRAADSWALLAAVVASGTAIAIWPVLGEDSSTWETWLVSLGALLSGICASVPRLMNYGERAGAARELTSSYGAVLGVLTDLRHVSSTSLRSKYEANALKALAEFDSAKQKKDALRRVGTRDEILAKRHRKATKKRKSVATQAAMSAKLEELDEALAALSERQEELSQAQLAQLSMPPERKADEVSSTVGRAPSKTVTR
jgi:hypothetical protein